MPSEVFYGPLEDFYSANEARRRSREVAYGVWWVNDRGAGHCRVSYVQATGEVYAVDLPGEEFAEVLGVVPPDPEEFTAGDNRTSRLTYGEYTLASCVIMPLLAEPHG